MENSASHYAFCGFTNDAMMFANKTQFQQHTDSGFVTSDQVAASIQRKYPPGEAINSILILVDT